MPTSCSRLTKYFIPCACGRGKKYGNIFTPCSTSHIHQYSPVHFLFAFAGRMPPAVSTVVKGRGWPYYSHSHNWKSVNTGNTYDLNYHPQQVIMTDTAKMYTSSFISPGNYWSQPLVFTPHCQYLLPLPTTWNTLSLILTDSCFSLLPSWRLPILLFAPILSLV